MTLPRGWTEIIIGDLGKWQGGGTPSKANPAFWTDGHIPWVSPKDMKRNLIDSAEDSITEDAIAASATNLIPAGAILLVTRSGILKHTLPVAETLKPVAINQDLKALSPHQGAISSFVRHAFQAMGQDILHDCAKAGTTVDSIDFERLKTRPFALPPTAEQRRIVAKLDALTARIARARAELDRVAVLVDRLRAATLRDAVEGALTLTSSKGSWNESQRNQLSHRRLAYLKARRGSRISKEVSADIHHLNGARLGWLDCNLADVVELRVGYAFKSSDFSDTGVRLLRGANVAPGRVDWDDAVSLPRNLSDQYQKYILDAGDIVIAMDRPLISSGLKIALLSDTDAGSLLVQRVANPRATEWIAQEYLYLVLRSHLFRQQIEDHATGSDLPHISANDILTTRCPLPPIDIQIEIARAVNAAFSRADRLEAEAARARALLDRLESAVLAKAFRGELAPQDENDEPASVLLERIRAQRAAAPKRMKAGRRAGTRG